MNNGRDRLSEESKIFAFLCSQGAKSQVIANQIIDATILRSASRLAAQPISRKTHRSINNTVVPADQSNGLNQASYSIKNKSEVISYKSAFEASYASDVFAASIAFVQQHQSAKLTNQSNGLDQASYEKKIKSGNIESANDVVFSEDHLPY